MERTEFQPEQSPVVAAVCDLAVIRDWGKPLPLPFPLRAGSTGLLLPGLGREIVPTSSCWLGASLPALAVSRGQQPLGSGVRWCLHALGPPPRCKEPL